MIIQKKRIHKLENYLGQIKEGQEIVLCKPIQDEQKEKKFLSRIGFHDIISNGDKVLPRANFGPVSRFNANGKEIPQKDQSKETVYREMLWTWMEWHGPEQVEQSKIVEVPYKRYPRIFVSPPSQELLIVEKDHENIIISDNFTYEEKNYNIIKHTINLFLEIFNECIVLTGDLEKIKIPKMRRLNWNILPPGKYPWNKIEEYVKDSIKRFGKRTLPVVQNRHRLLESFSPDFRAVGTAGFSGYIIFGYENKDIYICENIQYGNATYIFNKDWETFSKLTKADVINEKLMIDRVIHRKNWDIEIRKLLSQ